MPGRVLGSDKDYVSSEEGSRDPRKGTGVTVQASLRRRGVCNTTGPLSQSPLVTKPPAPGSLCQARETPSNSGGEKRKRGTVCN